jgi:hypothetical protein
VTANDVVLLEGMLKRHRERVSPDLSAVDHATFYATEQYLKNYHLSHEEVLDGIVDGEKDCGIDTIHMFANNICIRDDTPLAGLGRRVTLDLVLMQVKNTGGFSEDPINRLIANLPKIFVFDRDELALARSVNPRLIEISRRFLAAYRELDILELRIFVAFASLKAVHLHPNTVEKSKELESCVQSLFGNAQVAVNFLDAQTICEMSREQISTTHVLNLAENSISTDTAGGYIGVVKLADYERFITSDAGELDASLFEANVRDYEGETAVNQSIQQTLETQDDEVDFWWLNNGVTIVATNVQPANKLLKLESPQIVNGLQTSTEIYKRSRRSEADDARSVLVKVIEARNPTTRDRIIRATNSQTSFGPSALKATDRVQRDIEEYLGDRGLYYERRKRYYSNQGVPIQKIVSIEQMGQAVVSVLVQVPHVARGKATRIYDDDVYEDIFSADHALSMYAACISILRQCERFLLDLPDLRPQSLDFVFHLSSLVGIALTRRDRPSAIELGRLESVSVSPATMKPLLSLVQDEYARVTRRGGHVLLDQIAKDEAVGERILERGRSYMRSTRRGTS